MRVLLFCATITMMCAALATGDTSSAEISRLKSENEVPARIRNGAVMLRPVPLLENVLLGGFELAIQGQTAFSSSVGAAGILSTVFLDDSWTIKFRMGPQSRFQRNYLHGGLVGLLLGFGWTTDGTSSSWSFVSMAEFGYQWVLDTGFTVGVSTGPSLSVGNEISFEWEGNIQIGVAFPDPLFRPR